MQITNLFDFTKQNSISNLFRKIANDDLENEVVKYTKNLADSAFSDKPNPEALLEVHRTLYSIYTAHLITPWDNEAVNTSHPIFTKLKFILEDSWQKADKVRFKQLLSNLPKVDEFESWIVSHIESHSSNVGHPIFKYLRDDANTQQLTEFIRQESAFDLYFADLIGLMMLGIYDDKKSEMLENFWDEMGHGKPENMHRKMRLDMMEIVGIEPDDHLTSIETYCAEELAIANLYFQGALDRSRLIELTGMMLATENMVPGRLQYQIDGWKRNGFITDNIAYLVEHTTVDVVHAKGWMNNVVLPMLKNGNSTVMEELVFGVERRLYTAGIVCDVMLQKLKSMSVEKTKA